MCRRLRSVKSGSRMLGSMTYSALNGPTKPDIYTLSLHDALPISAGQGWCRNGIRLGAKRRPEEIERIRAQDRKSTRLNSSHQIISYAVFCLKKKITSFLHLSRVVATLPQPAKDGQPVSLSLVMPI